MSHNPWAWVLLALAVASGCGGSTVPSRDGAVDETRSSLDLSEFTGDVGGQDGVATDALALDEVERPRDQAALGETSGAADAAIDGVDGAFNTPTGATAVAGKATVGSDGGTVAVSDPASPIVGTRVDIPQGAVPANSPPAEITIREDDTVASAAPPVPHPG